MLSLRSTTVLCVLTLLLAAGTCWAVGDTPVLAAHLAAGIALGLAALSAPLVFSENELRFDAPAKALTKAAIAALWFGVAAAFMMLVASRVSPVNETGIAAAALWPAFLFWFSAMLSRSAPRAGLAILFGWIVALPVLGYLTAEVFLTGPVGANGLAEATAPQADLLRTAIHWVLNFSPGTAMMGALTGTLADGSEYSIWVAAMVQVGIAAMMCGLVLKMNGKSEVGMQLSPERAA